MWESDVGDFLKEVPHTPQELYERKKTFALATTSIPVRERKYAVLNNSYRKRRVPFPSAPLR